MVRIHPTAIVDSKAKIDDGVEIGPYCYIDGDVEIGKNAWVESHVRIAAGARIGPGVRIHHGAVVGTVPQDLKFKGEESLVVIGANTSIREYCSVNRGTDATGETRVGENCLLMMYVHIAHDCRIGNNVILVNAVNVAGHVNIDDYAIIGGVVPVHQFVRIGTHCMIGGGYRVPKDVPPYILAAGEPLEYGGLNSVGLRRRGYTASTLAELKNAYKLIYKSNLNVTQALEKIRDSMEMTPEVTAVVEFIENSERGIIG
jgi:UDP-N-acetylglucosamine acyltransferase